MDSVTHSLTFASAMTLFPKFCFKIQHSLTFASQINEEKVREPIVDKKRKPKNQGFQYNF